VEKQAFTRNEACKILNICPNTLAALIRENKLKAVKAGARKWLIPAFAIDQFLGKPEQFR
jgi:excisionase family DNA binding protein